MTRLWHAKWNVLRVLLAAAVVCTLWAGVPARLAKLKLAALPDLDYTSEVRNLRAQGRFGEALMVADAGLAVLEGDDRQRLIAERREVQDEQSSWLRRAREVGVGALTGTGDSAERLVGAIASDFFVVGDLRDLFIQGMSFANNGEADQVIVALSTIGVVTTLAPAVDWAPALLKAAKKAGAMTRGLGDFVVTAAKGKNWNALEKLCADTASLGSKLSPGGALRALKTCESAEDVAKAAALAERQAAKNAGPLFLHIGQERAVDYAKTGRLAGVELPERLAVDAARKGNRGLSFMSSPAAKALVTPHVIVGLLKGFTKGNIPALAQRVIESLEPHLWWLLPLACAWLVLEAWMLIDRLGRAPTPATRARSAPRAARAAA